MNFSRSRIPGAQRHTRSIPSSITIRPQRTLLAVALQGVLLGLAAGAVTLPQVALAETAATLPAGDEIHAFDVPAGPLDAALDHFARIAGVNLSYDAALVSGIQSQGVSGNHSIGSALNSLLAGSGLDAVAQAGGGYSLRKASTTTAASGAVTLSTLTVGATAHAADRLVTQSRPTTVGKSSVSVQDTPFAVSVVEVDQIRETGAKNVQDALLYSAGVYSGRYGFDTRGDWSAIRGLSPSSYIDGLRGIYGFYNNTRPEIYTLESIEVLKGPASVLYGQADIGGIVNVVSKRPQSTEAMEIDVQLGSYERKQVAADLTGPLNADATLLYRLVALKRDSNTQVDYVNDDAEVIMPSLTWKASEDTAITLQYIHQDNNTKVSSQFLPSKGTIDPAPLGRISSSLFAGEPDWDRYDMSKDEVSLLWDQRLSPDWKLTVNLRKADTSAITREIYTTVGAIPDDAGNITRTVHAADRATDVLAADVRFEGILHLGPTRHTVGIGFDYQDAFWEEYNYFWQGGVGSFNLYNPVYGNVGALDLDALPVTDRPDNRIVQTGLYLMDHVEWGPWVLSGALRSDRARNEVLNISTPDTVVRNEEKTHRLGLMYRFDNGLSPYVSWSTSFSPNLGTDGTAAASYLKPTIGEQTEAGIKYLSTSGNTSVALAWFDIEQKNRISDGSTPGGVEQIGSTTNGWELELRQRMGALELMANYTKLEAINDVTKLRLSSIPEITASVWGQYEFASGMRAGLGGRHIGTVVGNGGAPTVPAVTLYDVMAGYSPGPWDLRLSIQNIADKEYISWCRGLNQDCGYGERRNVLLTGNYNF